MQSPPPKPPSSSTANTPTPNSPVDPTKSSSIQVVVRLRPMNEAEKKYGTLPVVTASTTQKTVTVIKDKNARQARLSYAFDNVMTAFSTQEEVFEQTLQPVIGDVLRGYESTVFAYGQTGTGKTYTMEGDLLDEERQGVIPRSARAIFEALGGETYSDYKVTCSYLEIYNEDLSDLLAEENIGGVLGASNGENLSPNAVSPTNAASNGTANGGSSVAPAASRKKTKLEIMEGKTGPFCRGLSETQVKSPQDVLDLMNRAQQHRQISETKMNKSSSRSHCIFTLKVKAKTTVMDGSGQLEFNGKLHLVDLAGSECAKSASLDRNSHSSSSEAARERERMNINRSLLTLGRVISMLKSQSEATGHSKKTMRIPYRDSKLTRILQESLGGRCKTVIIATLSPSVTAIEESISTLNYAQSANGIINKPVATSYLSLQTSMTPNKAGAANGDAANGVGPDGTSYRTVDDWNEMEIRLHYMQAQVEEAQAALARKHALQQEAEDKMDEAVAEKVGLQEDLEKANQDIDTLKVDLDGENKKRREVERELDDTKKQLVYQTERGERAEAECKKLKGELEQLKEEMKKVKGELKKEIALKEDALSKLHDTRVSLKKTRLVLSATQTTEQSLTNEAKALLSTLHESVQDGDSLHATITQLHDQEVQRRASSRSFSTLTSEILSTTLSTLSTLSESIQTTTAHLLTTSDQHHTHGHKSISETIQLFQLMSSDLSDLASTIRNQLMGAGGMVPMVRATTSDSMAGLVHMTKIVTEGEEGLSASFAFLRGRLAEHEAELGRLWMVHDANSESAMKGLEFNVEEAKVKMEKMVKSVNETLETVKETQSDVRKIQCELIDEWESKSGEVSDQIANDAEHRSKTVGDSLQVFRDEMKQHDEMDDTLSSQKTFLSHVVGDLHKNELTRQHDGLTKQRSVCTENQTQHRLIRDSFIKNVMEGVQTLIDDQMKIMSQHNEEHFDFILKTNDQLTQKNDTLQQSTEKIMTDMTKTNTSLNDTLKLVRTNDANAADSMEQARKTLSDLTDTSRTHKASTSKFAKRAQEHMTDLSKLDSETTTLVSKISHDGEDYVDHLKDTLHAKAKDGITFLTVSGSNIAHYGDAVVIPECSAALDGMEEPRAEVINKFQSATGKTTTRLETGREDVEGMAEEQCKKADEVRSYIRKKEDEYGCTVAKTSKAELDSYREGLTNKVKEHEGDSVGVLKGCEEQTVSVRTNMEDFVGTTLKANEEVDKVKDRKVLKFEETFSKTPEEKIIFEGIDFSSLDDDVGAAA